MEQFSWKNKREVEREIARIAPREAKPEKLREINSEESSLELTINKELREKLERLKALLSHKSPSLKMSGVLEIISDMALKQLGTSPKSEVTSEKTTSPEIVHASNNKKRSRYIPAKTKNIIFQRANHQCEFTTQNNKRCEATHFLEVDHKHPYSQNGSNHPQNLQILCRQHNQRKAKNFVG